MSSGSNAGHPAAAHVGDRVVSDAGNGICLNCVIDTFVVTVTCLTGLRGYDVGNGPGQD